MQLGFLEELKASPILDHSAEDFAAAPDAAVLRHHSGAAGGLREVRTQRPLLRQARLGVHLPRQGEAELLDRELQLEDCAARLPAEEPHQELGEDAGFRLHQVPLTFRYHVELLHEILDKFQILNVQLHGKMDQLARKEQISNVRFYYSSKTTAT